MRVQAESRLQQRAGFKLMTLWPWVHTDVKRSPANTGRPYYH